MTRTLASLLAVALLLGMAIPAHAGDDIRCHMDFSLSGWSLFYKTAKGSGEVTCSNGQRMHVHLRAKGGGLTVGKTRIEHGHGTFTGVRDIHEVLGHYAQAEAHAGADEAARAQIMTKGNVSLALTGKGRGWSLGVDFGAFIIER